MSNLCQFFDCGGGSGNNIQYQDISINGTSFEIPLFVGTLPNPQSYNYPDMTVRLNAYDIYTSSAKMPILYSSNYLPLWRTSADCGYLGAYKVHVYAYDIQTGDLHFIFSQGKINLSNTYYRTAIEGITRHYNSNDGKYYWVFWVEVQETSGNYDYELISVAVEEGNLSNQIVSSYGTSDYSYFGYTYK